ncbi:hypothetical protein Trydic_g19689 [Trypoxylus dichotomus]
MKEHKRCLKLRHVLSSAVAGHHLETGHNIYWKKLQSSQKILIREGMEIPKHPDDISREDVCYLSTIWKPLLQSAPHSSQATVQT